MRWTPRIVFALVVLALATMANVKVARAMYSRAILKQISPVPNTIFALHVGVWPESSPGWPAPHVGTVSCSEFDSRCWALRAKLTPTGFVETATYPVTEDPDVSRLALNVRIGFPFRCLQQNIRGETWHVPVPTSHTVALRRDDGISLVGGLTFPGRPIWIGFLANTAIFAVIAGLALGLLWRFIAWLALSRRVRIAKGLCAACGYSRTGLNADALCPECGASAGLRAQKPEA